MKDNILNISSQLFLEIGFKNVTMDDIAEKMGISKKTIYSSLKINMNLLKKVLNSFSKMLVMISNELKNRQSTPLKSYIVLSLKF